MAQPLPRRWLLASRLRISSLLTRMIIFFTWKVKIIFFDFASAESKDLIDFALFLIYIFFYPLQAQCLILNRLFGIYTPTAKTRLVIGALMPPIGDLTSTFRMLTTRNQIQKKQQLQSRQIQKTDPWLPRRQVRKSQQSTESSRCWTRSKRGLIIQNWRGNR